MCPVCRIPSAFVTPSEVWIDDPVEKKKLIEAYKSALREKPCKYFAQGTRTCQFGASCFYKHAYPDGRVEETKLRHCNTSEGSTKVVKTFRLWDFLEALEDERTSAENTIIFLQDSDSDGDWHRWLQIRTTNCTKEPRFPKMAHWVLQKSHKVKTWSAVTSHVPFMVALSFYLIRRVLLYLHFEACVTQLLGVLLPHLTAVVN